MNIHIKNTRFLCEDSLREGDIFVSEGKIASFDKPPEGFEADETINGKDRLCIPALVNSHTHAYMTVLRNCADDLPFEDWLFGSVMPREEKLTWEQAYKSSLLACAEMIRRGTGTFCDMHMFAGASAKAAEESGMRAVITRGLSGSDGGKRRLDEQLDEIKNFGGCGRLSFMLAPHSIYTCDEPYLREIADLSKQMNLGINIHLAESEPEYANCVREHGCTPVEYLRSLGLLGSKTVAAHCVRLTETDILLLAESGTSVAACPKSNLKLGNGFAPLAQLDAAGVNICIGTDSAASNNSLNMFSEMNYTALVHKGTNLDSTALGARKVFGFATKGGARALGISSLGEIKVGYKADIAILNLRVPQITPLNDAYAALCYCADGSETESLIIDGRTVMKNRELLTIDEEELYYYTEHQTF